MSTLVKWTVNNSGLGLALGQDMVFFEPEPLIPWLKKEKGELNYLKCPAVIDYVKNMYAIKSPFDYSFEFDAESNILVSQERDMEFFNTWLMKRQSNGSKNCFFTLNINAIFVSEKPVILEALPAMFHDNDFIRKINWVPGSFDISRWYRHAEVTCETREPKGTIKIKRGDVLFYVKLNPEKNDKVVLEKMSREEEQTVFPLARACTSIKRIQPGFNLKQCYELFDKIRPSKIFKRIFSQ